MADLLDAWSNLRQNAPWKNSGNEANREDAIDDLRAQIDDMYELEALLRRIDSLICEIPLQAIRIDVGLLETALRTFAGESNA